MKLKASIVRKMIIWSSKETVPNKYGNMGEPFFCLDDWKNNPMKWVFENSWASFCSCPFPKCYKTFLVHQRAWTCRYIPPFLLCSFATYLLHHLQCLEISGQVQHVSTLNESLSNCQRPEHLSFEVARWVRFKAFLQKAIVFFRLHFGIQNYLQDRHHPPTKIGEDLEPEGNSERICRSFPKTLAMPGVSGWRQRTGLPTTRSFQGRKNPGRLSFWNVFWYCTRTYLLIGRCCKFWNPRIQGNDERENSWTF